MNAEEKLRICLLKLLNVSALKLFGALVYKFDIAVIPSSNDGGPGTAFVALDVKTKLPIMRFYKSFLDTLSIEELLYVVIHEILHILDNHCSRGLKAQYPELFNIAADHVINDMLDTDARGSLSNKIRSPDDRVILNHFKGKNVSTEEVYGFLIDNAEFETQTISLDGNGQSSDGDGDGDGTEGKPSNAPGGIKPGNENGELTVKTIKVTMPDGQVIEHTVDVKLNKDITEEDAKKVSQQMQAEARSVMSSSTFKGDTSLKIAAHIEEIIKVEIPWDTILENAIKSTVVISADNKSWRGTNKRMRAHDITLPGNDTEETADDLYIVIDSSGSVSDSDLAKFADIIKQSMIHFKTLHIIKHDTEVYGGVIEMTREETFDLTHEAFKIDRRGGTCHIDPFDLLEEEYVEYDSMGLIILLTDFYSNIVEIWNNYTFTHNIPMKILLPEHGSNFDIPEYIDKQPIVIKEPKY